jgi:PAS domain S-box-containing protein
MNAVAQQLTGWSQDEAAGRPLLEVFRIVNEDSREVTESPAEKALRVGQVVGLANHTVLISKNGSEIPIDDSAAPIRDEQGSVHGVVLVFRNITERRKAEIVQGRLAAIVESSQDAIISMTLSGEVLSWNEGAQQLYGYSPAEVIGHAITMIIPPPRHDEELVILDRVRRGERVEHYETRRLTKEGGLVDVSLTVSPVRDREGRIIAASKIARDITARKRAEERLALHTRVTHLLAEADTLEQAATKILAAFCENSEWQVGALWYVDNAAAVLRCAEVCSQPGVKAPGFEAMTRELTFKRGRGLPGRVWQSGIVHTIRDVVTDDNFPRYAIAAEAGLHGAVGFPITLNDQVFGVMEFFSHRVREADPDIIEMMTAIGSQIGQFIERKRAEDALRESEQRFRVMASNIPSIIWTAAPDGTITYANERWFEYCALTPEENARGWPELVLHPDDRERCITAWSAALRDGTPYQIEVRNRRHDGVYRWFMTRAVPAKDSSGRVVAWFGNTSEIHEQKEAEQTTKFLADASAALATLTDYESTLQRVASLAVPFFADWCTVDIVDPDESVRRLATMHKDPEKVKLLQAVSARYPSRNDERIGVMRVIRTGEAEWAASVPKAELEALAQSPEHLLFINALGIRSYICVPMKSRSRTIGVLTFVTAESGRVYDSKDVQAAQDLADRAVIAIENSTLLGALKDADKRKDEFLAMLAHELRNPLAPIRNAVGIFRAKAPPNPELRWATEVVDRQVQQMARLVNDLLDVSRITRGKIELRKQVVNLAEVFEAAIEASKPTIEKWDHHLTVTLPDEGVSIVADPTRLAQVVANLLNNAAKYTDKGGEIILAAHVVDDDVVISVKDNGIGIPVADLNRVFDMFIQMDHTLERSEGGLGIGLTLVRRLVEMHGGDVEAHSEGPGTGSEFIVRLPLGRAVDAGGVLTSTAVVPTSVRRILIVDDNQDAADSLGMFLRIQGNHVKTAYDGLEAIRVAAEFRPDVVLLDIGLPKLNGYEVARRIRAQEDGYRALLIAVTGWGQEDDRRRSQAAGFDHHITKPIEFEVLQKILVESQDKA